jgi:hypothetical protein
MIPKSFTLNNGGKIPSLGLGTVSQKLLLQFIMLIHGPPSLFRLLLVFGLVSASTQLLIDLPIPHIHSVYLLPLSPFSPILTAVAIPVSLDTVFSANHRGSPT